MKTHPAVKALAQAIVAKGRDAEGRGQYAEAAEDYVTVVQLGVNYEHGPLIYLLVGAAIEGIGMRGLKPVISKLSNKDIEAVARRVQSINRERISMNEVLRREEYFAANNATNLVELVKARFGRGRRTIVAKARKIHNKCATECEGVAGAAAALVYQRENSRALANIESLTPKFLAHVPRDEFGNGRMRLLVLPAGSAIYSVGENERDEQGRGDDIAYSFQDIVARTNVSGSSP
jgi:hypothetical protein